MIEVAFRELQAVWFQVTGTLCNLACRHCFNASGPKDPWLAGIDGTLVRRYVAEAEALGVKELYFTGGEPLLHPDIEPLLAHALTAAPTTLLTNGTLIDERRADRLAALAARSPYSFEVRISIDAPTARANDAVRGRGSFARALAAVRRLAARGVLPIVTATEIVAANGGGSLYDRLRVVLRDAGVGRPRVKILPVLPIGRCQGSALERHLGPDEAERLDPFRLQCTETRVIAAGGIYACPILAGLPGARLGADRLADTLGPVPLGHRACYTCYETGIACRNF